MKIKVVSKKMTPQGYEIRKELVSYDDGKIESRYACYSPDGTYLGGTKEAEKNLATHNAKLKRDAEKQVKKVKKASYDSV